MTADHQPKPPGTAADPARSPPALHVVRAPQSTVPGDSVPGDDVEREATRALVTAARSGDTEAFRQIVEQFQDRVFRVVISVLHCDRAIGEDLCQEVFLRVWRGLPAFDGSDRFHAWLHTIATNVAITEYRKRRAMKRAQRTLSLDAPIGGSDDLFLDPAGRERDPADRADHREFHARVRQCVRDLPDEFRDAVVLRDLEALSYEEIGTILVLPPGTVRSRIHRGRLLLQKMLEGFQP